MAPPLITQDGVTIKIEWVEPNSGSLSIDSYLIEI